MSGAGVQVEMGVDVGQNGQENLRVSLTVVSLSLLGSSGEGGRGEVLSSLPKSIGPMPVWPQVWLNL
jgi:hypothetical protein